jgi:DNA-binding NarL/FixJ family response regulator
MRRLLLIEDDQITRRSTTRLLVRDGHEVEEASTLREARELLGSSPFERTILDVTLPDGDGLDLLAWMRKHAFHMPVLVVTGHLDTALSTRAYLLGAVLVHKPTRPEVIRRFAAGCDGLLETTRRFAVEHQLSPRQTELLLKIARGTPRASLSRTLGIRENTVKTMVRQILEKTDALSIDELRCRVMERSTPS